MLKNIEDCAKQLVREGFVIVPPHIHNIATKTIDEAGQGSQETIQYLMGLNCPTAVRRQGEEKAELGLVYRDPEEGKDVKYFFHFAHDLQMVTKKRSPKLEWYLREVGEQLTAMERLYYDLNYLINKILLRVSQQVSSLKELNPSLVEQFVETCYASLPDSTTTLRALSYPPSDFPQVARGHFDRSFITAHCGDSGGNLYGHRELGSGQSFLVSPGRGEILLFWGIKASLISRGILKPLWHSATAEPGRYREALVQFGHIEMLPPINNAWNAFVQYCDENHIDDRAAFYARMMQC